MSNHEHRDAHQNEHQKGQRPKHAETAAEEIFDEAEDAETRVLGDERNKERDSEGADALTPSPSAQADVQREQ
ncbi:hypothetical protein ACWGH5_08940 [Streptomyces sp. NPDC054864]